MGHSAKFFFNFFLLLLFFAEYFRSEHSVKFFFIFLLLFLFRKKILFLCRVQKRKHSANPLFAECFFWPSVFSSALGKELVCRVLESRILGKQNLL